MAKIYFRDAKISRKGMLMLQKVNDIIEEYQENDYVLTLRQLYYQLVSRDVIPNKVQEYSKLSILLKEGRMAGYVDWEAIEDRLRTAEKPSSWNDPTQIIKACIRSYQKDRQDNQQKYIEVWVEKDALSGVLERVTRPYHIPIMVNRGYSSATAMYAAFNRFNKAYKSGKSTLVLYLGDFDPSGKDMLRDIEKRISEFFIGDYQIEDDVSHSRVLEEFNFKLSPIALTEHQIRMYNPPPNPAKITDPRAAHFIKTYGASSWEVDALRPEVLSDILEKHIMNNMDIEEYNKILEQEKADITRITNLLNYL